MFRLQLRRTQPARRNRVARGRRQCTCVGARAKVMVFLYRYSWPHNGLCSDVRRMMGPRWFSNGLCLFGPTLHHRDCLAYYVIYEGFRSALLFFFFFLLHSLFYESSLGIMVFFSPGLSLFFLGLMDERWEGSVKCNRFTCNGLSIRWIIREMLMNIFVID